MKNNKLTYIDVFSGCGGLAHGMSNAGWKGLFAVEKDPDAFATLKHNLIDKKNHFNWPSWLPETNHDINEVIKNYKPELEALSGSVTLVAGGPPCQGFSTAGRRQEHDHRNKLIDSYINFIDLVKPHMLFFENVKGFTFKFKSDDANAKVYSQYVWDKLDALSYDVHGEILDFSDFGIPQTRKRFILVGIMKGHGEAKDFFNQIVKNKVEFLKSKGLSENTSLEDAINDLLKGDNFTDSPDTKGFNAGCYNPPSSPYQNLMRQGGNEVDEPVDSHRFANHTPHIVEKFNHLVTTAPRGENVGKYLSEKFGTRKTYCVVLDKNKPCPTLTTLPDDFIHYSEPRILTPREYARIQSFPDDFEFKGRYTTGNKARVLEVPRYSQIGNAIPPLFAEQSGLALKEMATK